MNTRSDRTGQDGKASDETVSFRPEHFELLFGNCRPERYQAGDYLFMHDDPSDRIYGVLSGIVEISTYSISGRKLVANIEQSRSLVGEIGALDTGPRTASAVCLTDCDLVSLNRPQLMRKLADNASLALAMIEILCLRLRWLNAERNDLALLKIEARLAKRLLLLGDGPSRKGSPEPPKDFLRHRPIAPWARCPLPSSSHLFGSRGFLLVE